MPETIRTLIRSFMIVLLFILLQGCSSLSTPSFGSTQTLKKFEEKELVQKALKLDAFVEEWGELKPALVRLAKLEGDINFFLEHLANTADIGPSLMISAQPHDLALVEGIADIDLNRINKFDGELLLPLDNAPAKLDFSDEAKSVDFDEKAPQMNFLSTPTTPDLAERAPTIILTNLSTKKPQTIRVDNFEGAAQALNLQTTHVFSNDKFTDVPRARAAPAINLKLSTSSDIPAGSVIIIDKFSDLTDNPPKTMVINTPIITANMVNVSAAMVKQTDAKFSNLVLKENSDPRDIVAMPSKLKTQSTCAVATNYETGINAIHLISLSSAAALSDAYANIKQMFANDICDDTPLVQQVNANGKIFYSLRIGPYSETTAEQLCAKISIAGDYCGVVSYEGQAL